MPQHNKTLGSPVRQKAFSLSLSDAPIKSKAFGGADNLSFVYKAKEYDESKTYRFIGTSEAKDRDDEIVLLDGWEFKNYEGNPIVLFMHDNRSLPIGKTVGILKDEVKRVLYFDIEFSKSYDFAKTVEGLVEEGILRAVSLGFRVLDWEWDAKQEALLLTKNELFEISVVNVPANQEALIQEGKAAPIESTKTADDLANVVSQLKDELESLRNQLQALTPSSDPQEDVEGDGEAETPNEELPKTNENDDTSKNEETTISTTIDPTVVAAIVAEVLAKLNPQAEENPIEETQVEEPKAEENEEESASEEEDTSEVESKEDELVFVSIEDLSETDGFVVVTEEEN